MLKEDKNLLKLESEVLQEEASFEITFTGIIHPHKGYDNWAGIPIEVNPNDPLPKVLRERLIVEGRKLAQKHLGWPMEETDGFFDPINGPAITIIRKEI